MLGDLGLTSKDVAREVLGKLVAARNVLDQDAASSKDVPDEMGRGDESWTS